MLSPPVSRDLVVVGAGIVGASVAYHAARAGAVVTLVEAGRPGAGVTADSFAWIGASGVRIGPAAGLRQTATEEYRRVEDELPGLPVTWSGSLSWGTEDGTPEAGPGQEIVDAATVATLEPNLRQPPEWAVWAPGDAAVDPAGVTERLVAGARAHGARVHPNTPVTAVRRDAAGRVVGVETAAGPHSGATVVLAAGVATAVLAATLGVEVPVEPSPCPLFRLRAPAGLVQTLIHNQDFDLRQVATDRIIAAADSPERTLAAVRSTFRGAENVELLSTRLGARPMPADGEPIVGPVAEVPGLYVAVMHSAVTLAPAVGRLVARELGRQHRRVGAGRLPPRPLLVSRVGVWSRPVEHPLAAMAIVRWVARRDNRWVPVPRVWPPKRPVWKPIVALVAWAAGIGFFLVGLMTGSSADVYRWVTTGLWLAIGALWLVQWRRAVKDFDRRTSE